MQLLAKEGMALEEAEERVQQVSKDMQATIGRPLSHTCNAFWKRNLCIGMAPHAHSVPFDSAPSRVHSDQSTKLVDVDIPCWAQID